MIDLKGIKNIIFDLGGVLLNLDFEATIRAFQNLGLDRAVLDKITGYADRIFYELELGETTPARFRSRVRELLNNNNISDREIDDAWCAMTLDIPGNRVKILQKLKKSFNLYLFSNTNMIHIDRLHASFKSQYGIGFTSLFLKNIYSHEIQDRKPNQSAFQKVIKITGVNPSETLFIDDLEKNIISAEGSGFRTFWLKEGTELSDVFPNN